MAENGEPAKADRAAEAAGRRSASERLAETRARLLDAVLVTLAERGYAGTSTTEVARRSGLTRGAQLHHFGTKDQMMVAAVNHLARQARAADIEAALAGVPGPQRLHAALAIISQLFTGVLPEAYVELWVASRSLPELAEALRESEVVARDAVRSLFGQELIDRANPQSWTRCSTSLSTPCGGMALDAHVAGEAERQVRADLILSLEAYFRQSLEEQP